MSITRRQLLQSTAALAAARGVYAANDTIQVGIAGSGARAQELIKNLAKSPGVEIIAVSDAYTGRMERSIMNAGAQAKPHKDYRQIMEDKSIDAVVVASPDHWHRSMVIEALNAGKDVYCEKPLTYRTSEGRDIIAAAKKSDRIVQVGSQMVSGSLAQKAKELIQAGRIGKVTMIRASYNRNTASGAWIYPIPPDASPQTVDWQSFLGPAPKRPFSLERFFRWRCYEDYSGGIPTDLFVHLCTQIHFIMGAQAPARVIALGQLYRWKESREVHDTINAVLEYPEGFAVNLSSTFNNQAEAEANVYFMGTEGTIALGSALTIYPERARENNSWIVESWPKPLEEGYYKDPKVRQSEMGEGLPPRNLEPERIRNTGDATAAHIANWVEAIRTRKPHWEDATMGHRAAACAHMVNLSAKRRSLVEWDFAKDDVKKA